MAISKDHCGQIDKALLKSRKPIRHSISHQLLLKAMV